ncbi:MAG: hypothetical protein QXH91_00130 [Candidatus Bathyarchaeia archaeon]
MVIKWHGVYGQPYVDIHPGFGLKEEKYGFQQIGYIHYVLKSWKKSVL